jgi:hypothetical protein
MKSKISIVLISGFVVCLSALTTLAQEEEKKDQLIWMREIAVKPPMVGECVEAMKDYIALGSISLRGQ